MNIRRNSIILSLLFLAPAMLLLISSSPRYLREKAQVLDNPILFALVPPPMHTSTSYGHQMETFGNHLTSMEAAPRGGDLCMMDVNGTIRYLTKEAGFGIPSGEIQTQNGIAVRQPCISWDGKKALFSMVIGGPKQRYDVSYQNNKWQIYEITNLDEVAHLGKVANIVKVPGQPNYNNISPIYGTDDQIIYISDAPLFGLTHTYPQKDEYESTPIPTGIFKLNPATGKVVHLTHSTSGDTDLFMASDGRVLSTKWHHFKRDQQIDNQRYGNGNFGAKTFESEQADAKPIVAPQFKNGKPFADSKGVPYESFPEALSAEDPTRDPNERLFDFNEFMTWEIAENGEGSQTMNHMGRHEFGGPFIDGSKINDNNLKFDVGQFTKNQYWGTMKTDAGIFDIKEDPRPGHQGTFYCTYSREFKRFKSGRILEFNMPIGFNPKDLEIIDWTDPNIDDGANKGHFRNPVMLMNGTMLVSYATQNDFFDPTVIDPDGPLPLGTNPPFRKAPYHFQIRKMKKLNTNPNNTEHVAGERLTGSGIKRTIKYWENDAQPMQDTISMNEVDVVEIVSRTRPTKIAENHIEAIEKQVLDEEGIDENQLRLWMKERNLALIVVRDMTKRDKADIQQPFNLRVPGGVSTTPKGGKVYDISHFQVVQADLVRGYDKPGRRVIATPMHNNAQNETIESTNLLDPAAPKGSVKIAADGSVAVFVPAIRQLSWLTRSPTQEPIVRDRQWVSFAPGEIRTCAGCHGINDKNAVPQNKPEALRELLRTWKSDFNDLITSVPIGEVKSGGTTLYANYPNPVSNSTEISYALGKEANVVLRIYNSQGQLIKILVNEIQKAGTHKILWNAKNSENNKVTTGTYVCSLEVSGKVLSNKMVVID